MSNLLIVWIVWIVWIVLGAIVQRFIEGETRTQVTLLPGCLDDYVAEANPVRVVDGFADELELGALGFEGVDPAATGRPAYHLAILLKIYIYVYLNGSKFKAFNHRDRNFTQSRVKARMQQIEQAWTHGSLSLVTKLQREKNRASHVCRSFLFVV